MYFGQYEIYLIDLNPTIGSEINKTRPCVIISPDEYNNNLNTLIVSPITSNLREYPTRVRISNSKLNGMIALDQIRTIDKKRILKYIDKLNSDEYHKVKEILKEFLID